MKHPLIASENAMKTALHFDFLKHEQVRCRLCPHNCTLSPGERGTCGVRRNVHGNMVSENYGLITALNFDPIEKKPLYHYFPGSRILSIGSIGCNLSCFFCQNSSISTVTIDTYKAGNRMTDTEIMDLIKGDEKNIGVAFTYNEPTVYFEYMLELSARVKEQGMHNVVVTNGYINSGPLEELLPNIDAFNVDLKAFTEKFYREAAGAHLAPVKSTLKAIKSSGRHLEITFLVVPTRNDDERHFKEMIKWICGELGQETVLHLSRYFPAYKSEIPKTSLSTLYRLYNVAKEHLSYVYLGNVSGSESQNTICGSCGRIVISRYEYFIQKNGIDQAGNCIYCKNKIVIT